MKKAKNHINVIGITSVIVFLTAFGIAKAQNNLNITFRPGANFPTGNFGETKLSNGTCGFETIIAYRFMPNFQAYGGWGANWFSENESNADSKLQFMETGYSFGLQFIHPLSSESKLNFIVGGGGIYNHIETENSNGDVIHDTGHGWGWQADAGLMIPIGHHNRWDLIPTVRYHALASDVMSEGVSTPADLNYFSVGLGVSWKIWSCNAEK